ncbi:MAG: hypothetical protein E7266_07690 [Lachnospiraceae bacterium]|nr:hypothetical protein [Lachnospiraceae bacterium]
MRRSRRSVRQLGQSIDIMNIILAVVMIALVVVLIATSAENKILFSVIFGIEALINLLSGIKQAASSETLRAILLFTASVIMVLVTIFTTMVIL